MTNVSERQQSIPGVFENMKSRDEVLKEIQSIPAVHNEFLKLNENFKEQFIQFCMGVRGVQMTYDPFFKKIFDAEVHPERLSSLLSEILGKNLRIRRMLPSDHRRITEKGSLLIMDMLVEFDNGELADVEIQKVGYLFPGQRASCYSADMVMRQYERTKNLRGEDFSYKDLKKVYSIIIMEDSSKELKKIPDVYIHQGKCKFDTGLELGLLQEFYLIPLDIFLHIMDNKEKEKPLDKLEAWLYFIGSDKAEHIYRVTRDHPWFMELYEDINEFRQHPEEAIAMFSDALRILDENTTRYMIDELKQEINDQKETIDTQKEMIDTQKQIITKLQRKLNEQKK